MDGTLLDVELNFCYLGDLLYMCAGGGCKLAIIIRCGIAWGKFERLLPILTPKHVSLWTSGKVFNACVLSPLLHGSETWAPTPGIPLGHLIIPLGGGGWERMGWLGAGLCLSRMQ